MGAGPAPATTSYPGRDEDVGQVAGKKSIASAADRASDPALLWEEPQHPKGADATEAEVVEFRAKRRAAIDAEIVRVKRLGAPTNEETKSFDLKLTKESFIHLKL